MSSEQITIFIYFYSTVTQTTAALVGFAGIFIIFQFQFLINSIEKWALFVLENINIGKTVNTNYYKSTFNETDLIISQFTIALTDFEPKSIKDLSHSLLTESEILFKGILPKSSTPNIFTCSSRISKLVDKYYSLKRSTFYLFVSGSILILISLISHFILLKKSICLHSIIAILICVFCIYFLISIYKIMKVTFS